MSAALAGGKGAALARLAATFPVPAFFVIAPDGRIAHAEGGFGSEGFIGTLRERIDAARK